VRHNHLGEIVTASNDLMAIAAAKKKSLQQRHRELQSGAPQPISTNSLSNLCPVGQYMKQDSTQCSLCLPNSLFFDRSRPIDLKQNSIIDKECPSAFVDNKIGVTC